MVKLLDCTLRDGGYYNSWDYSTDIVENYLLAMDALNVDYIEIGFRSLNNNGFKGGLAYSTEDFLKTLKIPEGLESKLGVMVNGSELSDPETQTNTLEKLFVPAADSVVSLVRIACHIHEFEACLPASEWLKKRGYVVGFNLMQIADRELPDITNLARKASNYPLDVLYFADSMGSLSPPQVTSIVEAFKQGWHGELGIHTHDNMGLAISNTLQSIENGATWVDSTVTGMGRGPGNAQTEYLSIAIENRRTQKGNPTKLFELIRKYFKPMQEQYGWGINPYYYLAGKYGIHPTYIQEMLQDSRYSDEDKIAVIEHLRVEGGKKFSYGTLESARHFYSGEPRGSWEPEKEFASRDVLIIGTGPSTRKYKSAIEQYIKTKKPYVIALNTESSLSQSLVDARAACHPVRLLADCAEHLNLKQPLITPLTMLPEDVQAELSNKAIYNYGLSVKPDEFGFFEEHCIVPSSLVMGYAFAVATSGRAARILMAGFDGYKDGDPRNLESEQVIKQYLATEGHLELISITPTRYKIESKSLYAPE